MLVVKVSDLVGKNAISIQSGTKLYELISPKLLAGEEIEINFNKVSLYASPFFNASVGLLLKDISIEDLMVNLKVVDINDIGRDLLNNVINNAINFYSKESKITEVLNQSSKHKGNDGELS